MSPCRRCTSSCPGTSTIRPTPSGGNAYDRRVCAGLTAAGWTVREHAVPGDWPHPDAAGAGRPGRAARGRCPTAPSVLLDGLVASAVPELLAPQAGRLRLVVLVHMPLGDEAEARGAGRAPTARRHHQWLDPATGCWPGIHSLRPGCTVAVPGVDPAAARARHGHRHELLCVAAVTPAKGHDVLVDALAGLADRPWTLVCVGALDRDPAFVAALRRRADRDGLADRVRLAGPLTGPALDAAYAAADLLVLASRAETYGMVVTEALARGLPVLATDRRRAARGARAGPPDGTPPGTAGAPRRSGGPGRCAAPLAAPADAARAAAAGRPGTGGPTLTGWPATTTVISPGAGRSGGHDRVRHRRRSPTGCGCGSPPTPRPAPGAGRPAPRPGCAGRRRPPVIHDLGSGTGSMARWLAPRLPGPQHWVLHDRDAGPAGPGRAPACAGRRRRQPRSPSTTRQGDLTRLTAADLADADLVTASALLDMLTAEEIDRVVAACAGAAARPCSPLSVVGRVRVRPGRPAGRRDRRRVQRPPAAYRRRPATARAGRRRGHRRRVRAGTASP